MSGDQASALLQVVVEEHQFPLQPFLDSQGRQRPGREAIMEARTDRAAGSRTTPQVASVPDEARAPTPSASRILPLAARAVRRGRPRFRHFLLLPAPPLR